MRITVRRVLELLATYPDPDALLADYRYLEAGDLQQSLEYAAANMETPCVSISLGTAE
jgi:uncharacterized protein (DUF433 family)